MSIKLYHGYRIKSTDIIEITKVLNEVGVAYDKAAKIYLATLVAHVMANSWDALTLSPELIERDEELRGLKDYSISMHAHDFIEGRKQKIKATEKRDPVYDFQLDVVIFPEANQIDTLALVFTENETFRRAFADHPMVESFPYWDNTDRPDELTDEQWEQRGKRWVDLIGHDTPSRRGLTRQFEQRFGPDVHYDDIMPCFPKIENRAEKWAMDSLINDYGKNQECPPRNEIYSWLNRARAWAKAENRLPNRIAEILPKMSNPTKEQLHKWPEKK